MPISIDTPLPVCNPGDCTDLQVNYLATKPTGTYTVAPILHTVPAITTIGTELAIDENDHRDDIWGGIVPLPFNFCFYGQKYDRILVGTNGVVTFNIDPAYPGGIPGGVEEPYVDGGCNWGFNQNLPSPGFHTANAIYGVYQDTEYRRYGPTQTINTAPTGIVDIFTQYIKYYVEGTAPNRRFIVHYSKIPHYSCGGDSQTSYIVMYETTNVIDVIVTSRTRCTGWQNGVGVIGVMNQAGTLGTVPPGRNTNDAWTASNEAWRFTPSQAGPSNATLTWLENGTPMAASTTNVNPLNVCPTVNPTTYTAIVTYTECDGSTVTIQDTETVKIEDFPLREPVPKTICVTGAGPYPFNIDQTAYMLNGLPASDYSIVYHAGSETGTVIPAANLSSYLSAGAGELIWVVVEVFNTGCIKSKSFPLNAVSTPSGTFSYTGSPYCSDVTTPQLPTLSGLTSGGT
ncbi:hypothetical protein E4635_09815, partial [Flavobacterium humi]